jgi:small GTP-binding protein
MTTIAAAPAHLPEFKIVFVGTQSVGKTSIIMKYSNNNFSEDRQSTIGSAFVSRQVKTDHGLANLQIWDTAGQERYRSLVPMYSRGAAVAVVVFDLTSHESFEDLDEWIAQIETDMNLVCAIVVAANKTDIVPPLVDQDEIDKWHENNSAVVRDVVRVSAKTGENIEELFEAVCAQLPEAAFQLQNAGMVIDTQPKKPSGCC